MKRSTAWALGSLFAGAIALAACSGDVSDTSGSGGTAGAGGHGGKSGTGGAGTGGSTSTPSTGGSGGQGGGNACTMACDHAAGCGEDICNFPMIMVDCSNPNALDDCLVDCIKDASCDDIMQAANQQSGPVFSCALGCIQGGTGGGGGSGGGSAAACGNCVAGGCMDEIAACAGDMSDHGCAAWLNCFQGCTDPDTCACDTENLPAAPLYQPLYACACAETQCTADCAAFDPCGQHPPSGTGGGGGTGGIPN